MLTAEQVIEKYSLEILPGEGGYYREMYRSPEILEKDGLPGRYSGSRCMSTAILYMLTPDTFSSMHKLESDEVFHFYAGDPVIQVQLYPDGSGKLITLGSDPEAGHQFQVLVPRGVWQGTFLADGGSWGLMGTTVAPGFEFSDYQHGDRAELIDWYPDFADYITQLT